MIKLWTLVAWLACCTEGLSQVSDYIVLRKKNNRTLKTYFPGSYISAATFNGASINGIIREINNDSLLIEQRDIFQVKTRFGVPALDTVEYLLQIHFRDITTFYAHAGGPGSKSRKSGGVSIPTILMIGGAGYAILELSNTIYREESLDEDKLKGIGIAVAVAATGLIWREWRKERRKPGNKYKVYYIEMD